LIWISSFFPKEGGRAMNEQILLYEELSLNAWPSLQTQFYDGWVLRYTNGYSYTSRANSVNLLFPSSLDVCDKIAECERRYFAQGVPAIFKITDGVDAEFDKLLAERGYEVLTPTYLMTADMNNFSIVPGDCVMTNCIDNAWMEAYFSLSNYTDDMKKSIARQIFDNIKVDVICGRIIKNGATVACGLCVIERGYAGLFSVVVDESHRGKGYGEETCVSLISAAKQLGARSTYLQVIQSNQPAVNLYEKLGYKAIYSYWYRVKNNKG
jgi:ribosomal protein S18 acetylase RimI-like enzyme